MYTDETATVEAGLLNPASKVAVIDEKGDMIKIQIDGWRKAKASDV